MGEDPIRKHELEEQFKLLRDEFTEIFKKYIIQKIQYPMESVEEIVNNLRSDVKSMIEHGI